MNILFKDLTPGQTIFALMKGDELKYCEGSIVTVGPQRMEMPQSVPGQVSMPSFKNVVDVTYTLEGKNYTDAVDVTASVFPTNNPGTQSLVATDKEAVLRELNATLNTSENYLKEAEREVPRHEQLVKEAKALIAQLDTNFKEKQQTEKRFAKLEEAQQQQGEKLDQILGILKGKLASSTPNNNVEQNTK